jgi:hypothetical protein
VKEQLSDEKIDKLFKFVESKCVQYKDVQHEIVDHLASSIEEKQKEDSSLSFERALNQVYGKFPITGFAQLVEEKSTALNKYWIRKFMNFMFSYLKLPKIIFAGFLIYLIHYILSIGNVINAWQLYIVCVIFLISCLGYRYYFGFEFNKDFRDKYLVTNSYLALFGGISSVYLYAPLYMGFGNYSTSPKSWIMAIYITIVLLWIHAYTFEFPKMLKQELEEKYNHLNIKLA